MELGVLGEIAGDDLMRVHHALGAAGLHQADGLGARTDDEVAADQGVAFAGGNTDCADNLGSSLREIYCYATSTLLLRCPNVEQHIHAHYADDSVFMFQDD